VLYSEWVPPGHSWHSYTKNTTFNVTQQYWARNGWLDYRVPSPAGLPPYENLTLAKAESRCASSNDCFGFEFFHRDLRPPPTAVLNVTFRTEARLNPDVGNIVTLHNPAPVAVNGKALVVFARNKGQLFAMRALDANATRWETPSPINVSATPGPPGGITFTVPGQAWPRIAIAVGLDSPHGGAALLSDDNGTTWRVSGRANSRGGEAQIALAPNGSLLLNSRGPQQGVRWQSESRDLGETWSYPRILDFGFGSSCEGSLMRMPDSADLLFSHAGRVDNRWNRWNLTIWRSRNSGANWTSVAQVEEAMNASELMQLHTAYSTLTALPPAGGTSSASSSSYGHASGAIAGLAYERGPMPGSHITPSECGEYATIRWKQLDVSEKHEGSETRPEGARRRRS
jgi:hypothetical protein